MDRRKNGTKHHVITEAEGVPLAVRLTGSSRHDVTPLIPLVEAIPAIAGRVGRPVQRPQTLLADRAYDSDPHRKQLARRGIVPVIARRNTEHGSGLGGDAGTLSMHVHDLLNTTNLFIYARGGYTTAATGAGGDGGTVHLWYHGLILNFSDPNWGGPNNIPQLTAGNSTSGTFGTNGTLVYHKDSRIPRDADVNGNGYVDVGDRVQIHTNYGKISIDDDFVEACDINNDGIINIIDMSRIGFEYGTR